MELFGKQDPYVVISLGASKLRSKTHNNGGKEPVWNQTFSFELNGTESTFLAQVSDEDVGEDDLVGTATVRIQDVLKPGKPEVWINISNNAKNTGQIAFSATFVPFRSGTLDLTLLNGKDLPNEDFGKQDPYVKFYLDGKKIKMIAKSKVHKHGGKNPTWNETLTLDINGKEEYLDLEAWDEDIGLDDKIGAARIRVSDILNIGPDIQHIQLKRNNGKAAGSLSMNFRFHPR